MSIKKTLIIGKIKGFSIVELVVIISVIGILAGIVFVTYPGAVEKTKRNALITDMSNCQNALESYRNFHNRYPDSVNELGAGNTACNGNNEQQMIYRPTGINNASYDIIGSSPAIGQPYRASSDSSPIKFDGWYAIDIESKTSCGIYNFSVYCWIPGEKPKLLDVQGTEMEGKMMVQVSVSFRSSCALDNSGDVYCWTMPDTQFIDGLKPEKINFKNESNEIIKKKVDKIAAVIGGACALAENRIYCWMEYPINEPANSGSNNNQLGYILKKTDKPREPKTIYTDDDSLDWVELDGYAYSACGITNSNDTYCWGNNHGVEVTTKELPYKIDIKAKKVTISNNGTCILALSDNKVHCWGWNSISTRFFGESETNTDTFRERPLQDKYVSNETQEFDNVIIKDIQSYTGSTCLITSENIVYCWGKGSYGQLGNGEAPSNSLPVKVMDTYDTTYEFNDFIAFSGGGSTPCVQSGAGNLLCWGTYKYDISGTPYRDSNDLSSPYYINKNPTTLSNPSQWP